MSSNGIKALWFDWNGSKLNIKLVSLTVDGTKNGRFRKNDQNIWTIILTV